ncbi:MAG: hypothetical protein LC645_05585, partial [Geobacteraceae bacterium]|nr:hypothetical protein [Geobacteraceae bacterium]
FNAYLPFYEDVVLRHLMGSGVRHNVLMMDADQAAVEVGNHPPHSVGRLYTLAPIKAVAAFHPKVIFLVGEKKGVLFAGSHNLTLSGFGYNRELTNLIRYGGEDDIEGALLLSAAWASVLGWAESNAHILPNHILEMVQKVSDFAPWLQPDSTDVVEHCQVLAAQPNATSLWQQLRNFAGPSPVSRVTVSGAFFDSDLSFIETVQKELEPSELIVGVDPETVQFPMNKKRDGVAYVNCGSLGVEEKGSKTPGYLHAKSIFLEREGGQAVMAVGSANPSAPAWLADGVERNIEMMIARKGEEALEAADDLGLLSIESLPPLTEDDWHRIDSNWKADNSSGKDSDASPVVIAVATDTDVSFRVPGNNLPAVLECDLYSSAFEPPTSIRARLDGDEYHFSVEGNKIPSTYFHFSVSDKRYTGVIQYVKKIESLSRTNSQRAFNNALASLATGAPDLDSFVECIKGIINIGGSINTQKQTSRRSGSQGKSGSNEQQKEGAELSISLEEVAEKEKKRKQRLRGVDDLGYLLDVLLYNLRDDATVGMDDTLEERDSMGRSEEEQIDADDEDIDIEDQDIDDDHPAPPADNPLPRCHSKVHALVELACGQIKGLKDLKLEMPRLVIVLAGILSALRLLRGLEGKVPWVGAGGTTFPLKDRERLFAEIVHVLFDEETSVVNPVDGLAYLKEYDEFARLKGLIVWLAWEAGITFADQKPFNETSEECRARRNANRQYVALAQMIGSDEDVISEARQSIGPLSVGDMDWLDQLFRVDSLFSKVCEVPSALKDATSAEAGDFGFNGQRPDSGVREILQRGSGKHGLASHCSDKVRYVVTIHHPSQAGAQKCNLSSVTAPA